MFEKFSVDLLSHAVKLSTVYVDRLSGYLTIPEFMQDSTLAQVINAIRQSFADADVSVRLRSDGGSQFAFHNAINSYKDGE